MWQLYQRLLDPIPRGIKIQTAILGASWSYVEAEDFVGVASTNSEDSVGKRFPNWVGADLRDLAEQITSWNFQEASLGLAAINAWYHHPVQLNSFQNKQKGLFLKDENAFDAYDSLTAGKKVAFIGHFQHLENYLKHTESSVVLERKPQQGDYPDSACEYLLPEQDFVFITGCTLINKTLPRLLQLSEKAVVVLTGPSTPMTSKLFDFGVQECSGFVVTDSLKAMEVIAQGSHKGIFQHGQKRRFVTSPFA
jgi:uncharacterized protein (DUF4213/DUF364 family)